MYVPSLIDIKLFVNVAEAESLTRGAERSYMSLPAASIRMKALEERLGAKLLYRTSQGVTLTPAGKVFLHHSVIVLHQLERLEGELREYATGVKGHVRIFANTMSITEFLPSLLSSYLASHPDVNIALEEHLSPETIHALSEGVADIGIVGENVSMTGFEAKPFRQDRWVVITPLGHPLSDRQDVRFEEALEFEYVGLLEGSVNYGYLKQVAYAANKPLKVRIHVGNFEVLSNMVAAQVGIGMLPRSAAQRYAKTMPISIIPLTDSWAERNLYVCVRSLQELPAFARDLFDLLVDKQVPVTVSDGFNV